MIRSNKPFSVALLIVLIKPRLLSLILLTFSLVGLSLLQAPLSYADVPTNDNPAINNSTRSVIALPKPMTITITVTPTGSNSPLTLSSSSPVKLTVPATFDEVVSNPTSPVTGVAYYLGSKLLTIVKLAPYSYGFNTKAILNGNYSFVVKTYYLNGKTTNVTQKLIIANPYSFSQLHLALDRSIAVISIVLLVILVAVLYLFRRRFLASLWSSGTKQTASTDKLLSNSSYAVSSASSSQSSWRADSKKQQIIPIIVIVVGVSILGYQLLSASHAATPYGSVQAVNGLLSGDASKSSDGTSVVFGTTSSSGGSSTTTSSSTAPMESLNRLSSVKIYPASAASANGDYYTPWNPGSSTGEVDYDLSAVPASQRSKVLLAWSTGDDNGYSMDTFMNGSCVAGSTSLPVNYTVDVNSATGGTNPPTTGWVTAATVTNNIFYAGQNLVNMINPSTGIPYNWIRMNITNSTNGINLNFDLANASQGVTGDFMFIGDSITTYFGGHDNDDGAMGDNIADLVSAESGGAYHIITENAGVSCTTSANWSSVYSGFSSSPTINTVLANFPGDYVTLDLGTNDAWGGTGSPQTYYTDMQTLANDVIAAGKTPIIPDISWPNAGDGTTWDDGVKSFNNEISQLIESNPKIIAGPNMYSVLQDHSSWFIAPSAGVNNVHPNDEGINAYRCAWAYAITQNIYKITPSPISECTPYLSP
jgi:lysophospholipase L1-like esterase